MADDKEIAVTVGFNANGDIIAVTHKDEATLVSPGYHIDDEHPFTHTILAIWPVTMLILQDSSKPLQRRPCPKDKACNVWCPPGS